MEPVSPLGLRTFEGSFLLGRQFVAFRLAGGATPALSLIVSVHSLAAPVGVTYLYLLKLILHLSQLVLDLVAH